MLGLFLLFTALLDLSSACPLTLEPPELVTEVDEAAVVNCTTAVDGHRGMFWTHDGEKQEEDMDSFIVLPISQTGWKTKAKCTIRLNDTFECSEDLQIKLFKRPSNITVRSKEPAVEGKRLELKCEISDVATVQNLTVTWFINNTVDKTESFPSTNTTTSEFSSLLWDNVSREQQGTTFTCEASDSGPRGPLFVSNHTWKLSVEYAPEFGENESNMQVNQSSEVNLHCEAMGNPPPHYKWTKDGETVANTSFYNISQVNENMTLDCVASNDHGSATKTFFVTVMEKTPSEETTPEAPRSPGCPLTLTPDKILVKFGDSASSNCSTTETDADGLGWEATTNGLGLTPGTHLEWRTEEVQTWTIKAGCYITRQDGSQCTQHLSITIWKSPDEVQVSPVGSSVMVENQRHQLKCDVFNVAPAEKLQVNWFQDGELIHTDRPDNSRGSNTPKNVTSVFELIPKEKDNGANFTCEAELLLEQEQNPKVASTPFTADVQFKPRISSCPSIVVKENILKLENYGCEAKGNPKPSVSWYRKDKPVDPTKLLTRTDSGKYTIVFTNIIGNRSVSFSISVQYGPLFSCRDHYNVTENLNLEPECKAEGNPPPAVFLIKDGERFSLPKMWKKEDSGQYKMEAINIYGRAEHSLNINVLYVPRFSEESTTKEINIGGNLTLECNADGNPPPQLVWEKYPDSANIRVTSRGRQSHVQITEATSSDAGVYSCTATNQVGSVSRNVTVMIITGTSNMTSIIIYISVAAAVLLVLLVIVLLCRICRKKSGHYNVLVPLTARS